jgi:hypothetical protein
MSLASFLEMYGQSPSVSVTSTGPAGVVAAVGAADVAGGVLAAGVLAAGVLTGADEPPPSPARPPPSPARPPDADPDVEVVGAEDEPVHCR